VQRGEFRLINQLRRQDTEVEERSAKTICYARNIHLLAWNSAL